MRFDTLCDKCKQKFLFLINNSMNVKYERKLKNLKIVYSDIHLDSFSGISRYTAITTITIN